MRTSPTRFYAFIFAVVGGVLLAKGHFVGGAILVVAAVACLRAWRHRDHNERGMY